MDLRHEWKHEIGYGDLLALRSRLRAVMQADEHATDGRYQVRSLYFDNPEDKALREKKDGVNAREKFRIRYYNGDTSFIVLERKSKLNGFCRKEQAVLSAEEAGILTGPDFCEAKNSEKPLVRQLCMKREFQGLQPKTLVDYTREAFCCPAGNVRVTLDYGLRTGLHCTDFLNPGCVTIPAGDAPIILEVKWDEFLPAVIRDIVQVPGTHTSAFSKYAACRSYG